MAYKMIAIFKLLPGKADEEIERCKSSDSMLNTLKKFPGFISYEVVKINEDSIMTIQTWEEKKYLTEALPQAMASRSSIIEQRENIVISHEMHFGEIELSS